MSAIQLGGLNTGIDTKSMIQQLIAADSRRLLVYKHRREQQDTKRTAYNNLKIKLQDFQASIKKLSDSSKMKSYAVKSSDEDKVTASASNSAFEGTSSIEVHQLPTTDKWIHSGFDYKTDYVGEGKFIFTYNHEEVVVQTSSDTTVEELVGLINNDPDNPGVSASLIKYDNKWHMVLNGKDSGSDYAIKVNTSTTNRIVADNAFMSSDVEAGPSTRIVDLEGFSGLLGSTDTITISGTDETGAAISRDITVTNDTTLEQLVSEINTAFDGHATAKLVNGKIQLVDDAAGASSTTLSLSFTADAAGSASLTLPGFTTTVAGGQYASDIISSLDPSVSDNYYNSQVAQDSQIKVDGYPPGADEWITNSGNTIDNVISGVTLNLHDTTSAGQTIELSLTRNTESLKSDVKEMVSAYNTLVTYIQTETAYNPQTKVAGDLNGDYLTSTVKNLVRSPFTTTADGFVSDVDAFRYAADLGLEINAEGLMEFDENTFNEAVVKDYDDVLSLFGAQKTGSTTDAAIKFYGASKYTQSGNYDINVTVSGGVITSAQIRKQGQTTWNDATWTSDGVVTGNMDFDSNGNAVNPENGLQFTVDLTTDTAYSATVRVKQGFATKLDETLKDLLDSTDGRLKLGQNAIDDKIENLDSTIEREQKRLDREQERLTLKFARMEKYLTMIQQQFSGIQ